MTILFEDGVELTQTRRIRKSSSFDFVKLEQLNALSRKICAEPVSAAEFRAELKKIDQEKPKAATLYLGSVVTALSFTLSFWRRLVRQPACRAGRRDDLLFAAEGAAGVPQRGVLSGAGGLPRRERDLGAGTCGPSVPRQRNFHRRDHARHSGRRADERGARYAGRAHDLGPSAHRGISAAGLDAGHRLWQRNLSVWGVRDGYEFTHGAVFHRRLLPSDERAGATRSFRPLSTACSAGDFTFC